MLRFFFELPVDASNGGCPTHAGPSCVPTPSCRRTTEASRLQAEKDAGIPDAHSGPNAELYQNKVWISQIVPGIVSRLSSVVTVMMLAISV